MKAILLTLILAASSAAFAQSEHDADLTCANLKFLQESICTFGDGSGEVVTDSSVEHHTAEEWTKLFPILVKADDDAHAAMLKEHEEFRERSDAQTNAELARMSAECAALFNHDKKGCVRSGYVWQGKACVVKDAK